MGRDQAESLGPALQARACAGQSVDGHRAHPGVEKLSKEQYPEGEPQANPRCRDTDRAGICTDSGRSPLVAGCAGHSPAQQEDLYINPSSRPLVLKSRPSEASASLPPAAICHRFIEIFLALSGIEHQLTLEFGAAICGRDFFTSRRTHCQVRLHQFRLRKDSSQQVVEVQRPLLLPQHSEATDRIP